MLVILVPYETATVYIEITGRDWGVFSPKCSEFTNRILGDYGHGTLPVGELEY